MTVITKTIGRLPVNLGDYNSTRAYGKKNRVLLYGCEWESKVNNNTYAPAALNTTTGVITPDTTHWKLISGSYNTWLIDKGYQKMAASNVKDSNLNDTQDNINASIIGEIGSDSSANTIKGRIKGLETSVGSGGSVDERIAAEGAQHYLKSETYTKSEVNGMITTPDQEYVTVTATDQTTAVTDVLPATGEPDTVYRVGNWDGTQYDATRYSEYAWNTTLESYVKLSTKNVGIDDEPTAGSGNLVKSGGIDEVLNNNYGVFPFLTTENLPYYNSNGNPVYNSYRKKTQAIKCSEGDIFEVAVINSASLYTFAVLDSSMNVIPSLSKLGTEAYQAFIFIAPSDAAYIVASSFVENDVYIKKVNGLDNVSKSVLPQMIDNIGFLRNDLGSGRFLNDENRVYFTIDGSTVKAAYNQNRSRTEPIAVVEGEKFMYRLTNTTNVYQIAALDVNWNLISSDSVLGTYAQSVGTYTVPSGIKYLIFCVTNDFTALAYAYNEDSIYPRVSKAEDRVTAIESAITQIVSSKYRGTKISGFGEFPTNSDWTVTDNIKAVTSVTGFSSRLVHPAYTFEDGFRLCSTFTATGSKFEVLIGKISALSGTMIVLRYENQASYIDWYIGNTISSQTLTETTALQTINLANGNVSVCVEKYTNNFSYVQVTLTDDLGNTESVTKNCETVGFAWGNVVLALLSGTNVEITNLSYGYKVKDEIDLLIIGHSFIEGNSIDANKDKRFAALIENDLPEGQCLILGKGGEKASALKGYINYFASWFSNAKYALLDIGNNDIDTSDLENSQQALIADCEIISSLLLDKNIIPVWVVDGGNLHSYVNGVDKFATFHNWEMSQPYHVDTQKCFRTGNSNGADKFLSDEAHPTIAVHEAMFKCIKAQAGYLFNC